MSTAILFHMLGLGDHISYNGMARRLLVDKNLDKLYVLAWTHYGQLVAHMFRDEPRIQVVGIQSGAEYHHSRAAIEQLKPDALYLLGHTVLPGQPFNDLMRPGTEYKQISWADLSAQYPYGHRNYYDFMGIDWKHRFTDGYYARDMREEQRLFDKLNPNHEEYVFVQDDMNRGFTFDREKVLNLIGKDVKIISNDTSENLFHYGMLIQNAKQVHLMESSFRCFVETVPTEGVEFYLHHYIRNSERLVYNGQICPVETRKPWQVVL